MTASWEAYVSISSRATPQERALLREALDKIAAAPDGEGIELLRKARERNGGQIVPITTRDYGSGITLDYPPSPSGYVLNMDIKAIANLTFNDGGLSKPVSVMGMLVHELYHVADDQTHVVQATLARLGMVEKSDAVALFPPDMRAAMRAEAQQAMRDIKENRFFSIDPWEPYDAAKYPNLAKLHIYLSKEVDPKGYLSEHAAELKRIGATVAGAEKRESDATRYTDAFMQKSGCNEPWRGEYYNSARGDGRSVADARNPSCRGTSPTQGYAAQPIVGYEELGQLDVPQVRAHRAEQAPPTRFK